MSTDREVSKGIVCNPARLGGAPTVKGTRYSAEMVAGMCVDRDSIRTAIENYSGLSYVDIANVRGWDRKGRPA